jgi:hypothetical protein
MGGDPWIGTNSQPSRVLVDLGFEAFVFVRVIILAVEFVFVVAVFALLIKRHPVLALVLVVLVIIVEQVVVLVEIILVEVVADGFPFLVEDH